jgi:hypothetical protein
MKQVKIKSQDLYVGMLVVTTDMTEAQVYTISHIFENSHIVELQHKEGERQCMGGVDYLLIMRPTIKQIEYSIANYGPLLSMEELLDLA